MSTSVRYALCLGLAFASLIALAEASAQQTIQVGGVGPEGQGADMILVDLDPGGRDAILMAYDNPPGANSFRYRVGRNLNGNGVATGGWSAPIIVPGVGSEAQGAGATVTNLDADPRPELILMAYDNPPGPNSFRYIIGRNLNANGVATGGWSAPIVVPGVGSEARGAAVVAGYINNGTRPDLVLMAYDRVGNNNVFRYKIGWDLSVSGVATSWTNFPGIAGFGPNGQGAAATLTNLDANARPDLVLMAVEYPGSYNFRGWIGRNLSMTGVASSWQLTPAFPGAGHGAQGAGLVITCLDNDPHMDWILMEYDNPSGANNFRYQVLKNWWAAVCALP